MMRRFYIDHRARPPICLPAELDRAHLVDITTDGCAFRVFSDPSTGKVHDGLLHHWAFNCARIGVLMNWRKPEDGAEAEFAGGAPPWYRSKEAQS